MCCEYAVVTKCAAKGKQKNMTDKKARMIEEMVEENGDVRGSR